MPRNDNRDEQRGNIVCPYCFKDFFDWEVSFRSETVVEARGKAGVVNEDDTLFNRGKSKRYEAFWLEHGGDKNEIPDSLNTTPWELPVISAGNGIVPDSLEKDADGFVIAAKDSKEGRRTARRVCPFCNNPLPGNYGKYPVKRIAIIGSTGAGKTVYIRQLLNKILLYAANVALTASWLSTCEAAFIADNPIQNGGELPGSTPAKSFQPPMFYNIGYQEGGRNVTNTVVLYDIAGEVCEDAVEVDKYGEFIKHADGIILLITPEQFGLIAGADQRDVAALSLVLGTIHTKIADAGENQCKTPMAVCICQSDRCWDNLPDVAKAAYAGITDSSGYGAERIFNSADHNQLIDSNNDARSLAAQLWLNPATKPLAMTLRTKFETFNLFAVSALGSVDIVKENGKKIIKGNPDPRRIEEPLYWLFRWFGYINWDPDHKSLRPYPVKHLGQRYRKKGLLRHPEIDPDEPTETTYEEEPVRYFNQLWDKKYGWEAMT